MNAGRAGGISRGIGIVALLLVPLAGHSGCGPPDSVLQPLPAVPDGPVSFRATAEAAWKLGGVKRRGRIALAYGAPEAIRVELIDPMGAVGLALISAPEGAMTIDPGRRTYRRYRDGASALEALVGLPLPPERLAGALLGPAPDASRALSPARNDPGEVAPQSDAGASSGRPATPPTDGRIATGAGEVRLHWERDSGSALPAPPRTTEFRRSGRRGVLRVTLSDLRFESPDPDLFRLEPPVGFQSEAGEAGEAVGGAPR